MVDKIMDHKKIKDLMTGGVISVVDTDYANKLSKSVTIEEQVKQWASNRGIDKPENATKQVMKAMEELGELSAGVNKMDREKQIDSLGDLQVVLIILAKQLGIDYVGALESAYDVIKNRTGKTVNGVFIKSEDLKDE